MQIQEKLFLLGYIDKNDRVQSEFYVQGSTYLLMAGLAYLQEEGYIKILEDKSNIVGIRVEILKQEISKLNSFYQEIIKFVTNNPNLKDAGANADFLTKTSIFKIVESDLKNDGFIEEGSWKFLFFKGKKLVLSDKGKKAREAAVQEIRANILEDGEIDIEVIVNVLILEKLMWLKRYFSEFEQKELKEKIEMIKKANPDINTKILNLVSYISTFDDNLIILLGAVS